MMSYSLAVSSFTVNAAILLDDRSLMKGVRIV